VRNGDAVALRALLRDVNVFTSENFLYIREADQGLLTQYVLSLQRLRRAIHTTNDEDAVVVWEGIGGPIPSVPGDVDGLTQEVVGLRNRVLLQVRHAFPID